MPLFRSDDILFNDSLFVALDLSVSFCRFLCRLVCLSFASSPYLSPFPSPFSFLSLSLLSRHVSSTCSYLEACLGASEKFCRLSRDLAMSWDLRNIFRAITSWRFFAFWRLSAMSMCCWIWSDAAHGGGVSIVLVVEDKSIPTQAPP